MDKIVFEHVLNLFVSVISSLRGPHTLDQNLFSVESILKNRFGGLGRRVFGCDCWGDEFKPN